MSQTKSACRLLLPFIFAISVFGQGTKNIPNDLIETELSQFSDALAAQIRKSGLKKITILDLTDLHGNPVTLGAFIAEETTVNLVSSTNAFSVVDRANLNKILAEHKLTRTGLEEPENVKKLGHFSGVDAIVLGTLTPFKDDVRFSVKVISTETADIVGGAKGRLPKSPEISQLISPVSTNSNTTTTNTITTTAPTNTPGLHIPENSKQIGDLLVKVESMRLLPLESSYGYFLMTIICKNMGSKGTLGFGIYRDSTGEAKMFNHRGDEFSSTDISGIPSVYSEKDLFELKPGDTIAATIKYQGRWSGTAGDYGPYRFQAVFLVGEIEQGGVRNLKKANFVFDIPKAN